MDVRLAAEAFTRLSLSAPARVRVTSRAACQCRQLHLPATPYRQRTSTARWVQRRDISASSMRGASSAAAPADHRPSHDHLAYPAQQRHQSTPSQSTQTRRKMPSEDEIASIVDQSFQPGHNAAKRPSRFHPLQAQQPNRDSTTSQRPWQSSRFPSEGANKRRFGPLQRENTSDNTYMGRRQPRRSTAEMFEEAMRRDPIGSGTGQPRSQSSAGLIDSFITGEEHPDEKDDFNIEDMVEQVLGTATRRPAMTKPLPKSSLRLGSSVGRSIEVDPTRGLDLAKGINQMEARLSVNRVRTDYHRQKFHERPGLKRKRVARENWRRKFKAGFQHIVGRVQYLTRMGW